jgi:hypothetical protein
MATLPGGHARRLPVPSRPDVGQIVMPALAGADLDQVAELVGLA